MTPIAALVAWLAAHTQPRYLNLDIPAPRQPEWEPDIEGLPPRQVADLRRLTRYALAEGLTAWLAAVSEKQDGQA